MKPCAPLLLGLLALAPASDTLSVAGAAVELGTGERAVGRQVGLYVTKDRGGLADSDTTSATGVYNLFKHNVTDDMELYVFLEDSTDASAAPVVVKATRSGRDFLYSRPEDLKVASVSERALADPSGSASRVSDFASALNADLTTRVRLGLLDESAANEDARRRLTLAMDRVEPARRGELAAVIEGRLLSDSFAQQRRLAIFQRESLVALATSAVPGGVPRDRMATAGDRPPVRVLYTSSLGEPMADISRAFQASTDIRVTTTAVGREPRADELTNVDVVFLDGMPTTELARALQRNPASPFITLTVSGMREKPLVMLVRDPLGPAPGVGSFAKSVFTTDGQKLLAKFGFDPAGLEARVEAVKLIEQKIDSR